MKFFDRHLVLLLRSIMLLLLYLSSEVISIQAKTEQFSNLKVKEDQLENKKNLFRIFKIIFFNFILGS